jgi:hypothetical protein
MRGAGFLLAYVFARRAHAHGAHAHGAHAHGAHAHGAHAPARAPLAAAAAAGPLAAFAAPQNDTEVAGAALGAPFAVASAAACAAACLGNASCVAISVGARAPPPPASRCGIREECWAGNASSCPSVLSLACAGGVFSRVAFASYGLPRVDAGGGCNFTADAACDARGVAAIVAAACVGKAACALDVELAALGGIDPCVGHVKFLAVALEGACGAPPPPPPPGSLTCALAAYSRAFALASAPGLAYYLRLMPRDDAPLVPAVAFAVSPPPSGAVTLGGGGLLAQGFANNIAYVESVYGPRVDDMLFPYRKRHDPAYAGPGAIWSWDGFVPGSTASNALMGAGGALRWTESPALRALLDALVDGIAAAVDADGYAVGYPEAEINAPMHGNNQLPSYVNSWFTHGMLEAAHVRPDALGIARAFNSWWNNNSALPLLFPVDSGPNHTGPPPHGWDPAANMTSTEPFAVGHMLYWMNQAGIGHSRMAMSAAGTRADVAFLVNLFQEDWWLDQLAARDPAAIWARQWYPDNYEICVLEAFLDLYVATGTARYLDAVLGGWDLFKNFFMFPGGSIALNENYVYLPGALPLEFAGSWGVHTRPTGELCPSAFWTYLNQRLHRLDPANETYVAEIESALINVALAGQGPNGTGVRYFARLHGEKEEPTAKATCCEGQSARLFGAAPEFVFSVAPGRASVDLFEPAALAAASAAGAAVRVAVETAWPAAAAVRVVVTAPAALPRGDFALSVRVPAWAAGGAVAFTVGGAAAGAFAAGSYAVFDNSWPAGDTAVDFALPMALAPHPYTGETQKPPSARAAVTFGPFLLAAEGPWDAATDCIHLGAGVDASNPAAWLRADGGEPGALPSRFIAPGNVTYVPYYAIENGERFTAYPCFP